jgi:hypothetical protein
MRRTIKIPLTTVKQVQTQATAGNDALVFQGVEEIDNATSEEMFLEWVNTIFAYYQIQNPFSEKVTKIAVVKRNHRNDLVVFFDDIPSLKLTTVYKWVKTHGKLFDVVMGCEYK